MTIGIYADSKVQGPPFYPTVLPGLRIWFDAQDVASITQVAGAVSQWNDKSGNNFHVVQATGASQPMTGTTNINGRNTLAFDGTDDFLSTSAPVQLLNPTTGEWTAYVVVRMNNYSVIKGIIASDYGASGGVRALVMRTASPGNIQALTFVGNTGTTDSYTGAVAGTPYYFTGVHTLNDVEAFRLQGSNGVTVRSGTPNKGAMNLDIAAGRTAGVPTGGGIQGDLGEVIIYDVAHTSTDRTKVWNYIKSKWGL